MKRIILTSPSQCGEMSFTQCMWGGAFHYQKIQTIVWSLTTTDTPGGYLENCCLYSALLASTCGADIIALIFNVDTSWSPSSPGSTGPMNRPVIGLATKTNLANPQRISLVKSWLVQVGVQKVSVTGALENTKVDEMFIFPNVKGPSCLTE